MAEQNRDPAPSLTGPALLPAEILEYYTRQPETNRLTANADGALEFARTQELLLRHLPPSPASVLDVGGGTGSYGRWLADLGYAAHVLDIVPVHVQQALEESGRTSEHPLAGLMLADARALPFAEDSVDAVLLLGPLYHLTEREDRLLALTEARRVLRPGGVAVAVGVSRFASLLTGLYFDSFDDPDYAGIVERGLRDGQHRNPTARPYWTTAFFHHPDELRHEVIDAGLTLIDLVAVEGPSLVVRDLAAWWDNPARRGHLLAAIRAVEHEPSLLGLSSHVMAVARKS